MPTEKSSTRSKDQTPPVESPTESVNNEPEHKAPAPAPTPPPDGGLDAYLQVLGAHILFFNSWYVSPQREKALPKPYWSANLQC